MTQSPFDPKFDRWSVIEDLSEGNDWWLVDHPWRGGFACVSIEAATFAADLLNSSNKTAAPSAKQASQPRS